MNSCPCCSHKLLRHIQSHRVYWFCQHCWQEMPTIESASDSQFQVLSFVSSVGLIKALDRSPVLR